MRLDRDIFLRQFRHWSLHCSLNALPSFIIATFWLNLRKEPQAIMAMILAILTFIILYTLLTSSVAALSNRDHVLARALKLGTKVRVWVSVCSLPFLLDEKFLMWLPDTWCGVAAGWIIEAFRLTVGGGRTMDLLQSPSLVYCMTVLEGLILSALVMMISFFRPVIVR